MARTNYDAVTIQDCLENMQYKHKAVVLSNGIVAGFKEDEEDDESAEKRFCQHRSEHCRTPHKVIHSLP